MNLLNTNFHIEDHIRQIHEEGERRILASAVLARYEALSEEAEPLWKHLSYRAVYSGLIFQHLARTLAHLQNERE